MSRYIGVMAFCILMGSAAIASAQISADGSIRGYVRDEQEAALPGVTLTAAGTDVSGIFTAVSDSSGFYRLLNVPPGTYTLTAELSGFARHVRPSVVVRAGLNLGADITMTVGKLEQTIEVIAETPILEITKATQGINIDGDFQRSLPLGTRRD